jgi:hypothetical protein
MYKQNLTPLDLAVKNSNPRLAMLSVVLCLAITSSFSFASNQTQSATAGETSQDQSSANAKSQSTIANDFKLPVTANSKHQSLEIHYLRYVLAPD